MTAMPTVASSSLPCRPTISWLAETEGFIPRWNFNKVLLDGEGEVVATWGSVMRPTARPVTDRIEALLP